MSNSLIYNLLDNQFRKNNLLGNITFNTPIGSVVITEKDIIGNAIQSWLREFLIINNINYSSPPSSQQFPDYIINPGISSQESLEVKAWNSSASPAFDLANFESYIDTLYIDPTKIDADYLIFGYQMNDKGDIYIKELYLKKIWEITTSSNSYPIRVQTKRNVIYNIRPATWYSKKSSKKVFQTRLDFAKALSATLIQYRGINPETQNWLTDIKTKYLTLTGNNL